mgnify:CR=1 FL=1|jgi:hypothetical protein
MASVISEISKASEISQRILDTVSKKSETKYNSQFSFANTA